MDVDLGGVAKGVAREISADVLRRRGLGGMVDADRKVGVAVSKSLRERYLESR